MPSYRKLEKLGEGNFWIESIFFLEFVLRRVVMSVHINDFIQLLAGSYGTVYLGCETNSRSLVAMKKVHLDLMDNGFPASYLR